jgi:hypothetical protein
MKKDTDTTDTTPTTAPALAIYEVLCESCKIGGVIAYRTARVNLTAEQATALNTAQPGTVKFLGI